MKVIIFIKELNIYFLNHIINKIPFYIVRRFFYKMFLNQIGINTFVSLNVKFLNPKNIILGNNTIIGYDSIIDGRGAKVVIGDNVDVSAQTNIWTLDHNPNSETHSNRAGQVTIENHCWLATRVTVLPNVKIKKGTVVASNAVITKDTDELNIMAGNPAKKIGNRKNNLNYKLNYFPRFK
mgnify:FL=1